MKRQIPQNGNLSMDQRAGRVGENGLVAPLGTSSIEISGERLHGAVFETATGDLLSTTGGFTLIELMIVITIIGILLSVAAPSYRSATVTANEAVLKKDLFTLRDVIDQYYADHGKYPASLHTLVDDGYVRSVPKDPFTLSSESWVEMQAEGEDQGIYDVHSGSDLVGLDGTPYNSW